MSEYPVEPCLSCGSKNHTMCMVCEHTWCTDCEAGGYCDCKGKYAQMTQPIKQELNKCYALIEEQGGEWVDRTYYEGKIAGLEFVLRKAAIIL